MSLQHWCFPRVRAWEFCRGSHSWIWNARYAPRCNIWLRTMWVCICWVRNRSTDAKCCLRMQRRDSFNSGRWPISSVHILFSGFVCQRFEACTVANVRIPWRYGSPCVCSIVQSCAEDIRVRAAQPFAKQSKGGCQGHPWWLSCNCQNLLLLWCV